MAASLTRLVPNQDDIQDNVFHFRYNCATDMYERLSSVSTRRNTGWRNMTYGDTRMKRHEDKNTMYTFLGRHPDHEKASIAWKIDMEGTGLHGKTLEMRAASQVTGNAQLTWNILYGDQSHVLKDSEVHEPYVVDVQGAPSVTIKAEMQGGDWKDAQLFRQHIVDMDNHPFEVKLQMEPTHTMSYRLTNFEKRQCMFQLRYNCANDVYHRKSSGTFVYGLKRGLYQCEGGMREEDDGHVYWARENGLDQAVYRWMIDLTDTDRSAEKMSLMAKCKTYGTGEVTWKICADEKSLIKPGEYLFRPRHINMKRSKVIVLEAVVSGGEGATPWKQAQLFRQLAGASEQVFDWKLYLVKDEPTA